MSPWERQQRQFGAWEGETMERRFVAFSEAIVLAELPAVLEIDELRLGMDHGQGTGKQTTYLVGYQRLTRTFFVLAERVCKENSGPADVADSILDALDEIGATVFDITAAKGDINSAGLTGGGRKYNAFIEEAIADALEYNQSPLRIGTPDKRRGSVDAGEAAINFAMKDGRFFVLSSCEALIESMKHYRGPNKSEKDEFYKNHIDGVRYAVGDLLLKQRRRQTAILMQ